jgi:hypothetical protein
MTATQQMITGDAKRALWNGLLKTTPARDRTAKNSSAGSQRNNRQLYSFSLSIIRNRDVDVLIDFTTGSSAFIIFILK